MRPDLTNAWKEVLRMAQLESISLENLRDRRGETRLTVVLPVLELDGHQYRLMDFSDHGFRAIVPMEYRVMGRTGCAILHLHAAGYSVHKHVDFTVVHVTRSEIGVTYQTVETISENSASLF